MTADRRPWTARRAALSFLLRDGGARDDDRRALAERLPAADRGLFLELVAGATRRRVTLDHVIGAYATAPLRKLHPAVAWALRLGLHQLLFLDGVPEHAAVHESVDLVPARLGRPPRRLVNAVLRTILRERRALTDPAPAPDVVAREGGRAWRLGRPVFPSPERDRVGWAAAHHGYAREAVEVFLMDYDLDDIERIMAASNLRPAITVRPNPRRGSPEELARLLEGEGHGLRALEGTPAWAWQGGGDPSKTTAFREGRFSVQGAFAARAVGLFGDVRGRRLLDVCAAPGGKACQLAEAGAGVVALSDSARGRRKIRENAERLRLDLAVESLAGHWPPPDDLAVDGILLDVPCTNTGVLGRRPEARHRISRASLDALVGVQRELLGPALDWLEARGGPAGVLYATCSVLGRENDLLVDGMLAERRGLQRTGTIGGLPFSADADGGYATLIRRREADESA